MINVKKIKNLAIAAALGLVIGMQSVMPVSAADSVCAKCKGTINSSAQLETWETREDCNLPEHRLTNCVIVTTHYVTTVYYSCAKGCYSRTVELPEQTEVRHISVI